MRRDLTTDVFKQLDVLRAELEKPKAFMGLAIGYNQEECVTQVDKIRAGMPREFKDAASIARETERMVYEAQSDAVVMVDEAKAEAHRLVTEAQSEADRVVEAARLTHDQLVSESEVLKVAKAQSEEYKASVERECRDLRRQADHYAYDVLSKLERAIGKVHQTVERGRAELEQPDSVVVQVREKARV